MVLYNVEHFLPSELSLLRPKRHCVVILLLAFIKPRSHRAAVGLVKNRCNGVDSYKQNQSPRGRAAVPRGRAAV